MNALFWRPTGMRKSYLLFIAAAAYAVNAGCARPAEAIPVEKKSIRGAVKKINRTENEWAKVLTPEQFQVLRRQGTERAFTGAYHDHHEKGTYLCAACKLPLFSSATKFESGTGWPSYYKPVDAANVEKITDSSHGMSRVEVRCARCGSHLGHVFDDGPRGPGAGADTRSSSHSADGPRPTGLRYCINSVSLLFQKE